MRKCDISNQKHVGQTARSAAGRPAGLDRKSTRLNSSHQITSYALFCLKKKTVAFEMRYFFASYELLSSYLKLCRENAPPCSSYTLAESIAAMFLSHYLT